MRFRWLGIVGALAAFAWPAAARADDGGTAQALFDQAVADLEQGNAKAACPAFAESQRIDPRPGTLFALADCEVALGKIASALGHYHEYIGWVSRLPDSSQQRHAERVALARGQVEALEPKVPTLVLALSPSAPSGTVVERDGVPFQGASLGVALPIDPGEHVIVTRAPGGAEERVSITLEAGESKRLELPQTPFAPPAAAPPAAAPPAVEPTARPPVENPKGDGSVQRTLAYVTGGVGIAGLLVGSITGLLAFDRKATVDDECPDGRNSCSKAGVDAADSGKSLATASTVAFAVGLAGVATGVTLILTAPDDEGRGAAWLGVTRSF
jgi:hypothetical protein